MRIRDCLNKPENTYNLPYLPGTTNPIYVSNEKGVALNKLNSSAISSLNIVSKDPKQQQELFNEYKAIFPDASNDDLIQYINSDIVPAAIGNYFNYNINLINTGKVASADAVLNHYYKRTGFVPTKEQENTLKDKYNAAISLDQNEDRRQIIQEMIGIILEPQKEEKTLTPSKNMTNTSIKAELNFGEKWFKDALAKGWEFNIPYEASEAGAIMGFNGAYYTVKDGKAELRAVSLPDNSVVTKDNISKVDFNAIKDKNLLNKLQNLLPKESAKPTTKENSENTSIDTSSKILSTYGQKFYDALLRHGYSLNIPEEAASVGATYGQPSGENITRYERQTDRGTSELVAIGVGENDVITRNVAAKIPRNTVGLGLVNLLDTLEFNRDTIPDFNEITFARVLDTLGRQTDKSEELRNRLRNGEPYNIINEYL